MRLDLPKGSTLFLHHHGTTTIPVRCRRYWTRWKHRERDAQTGPEPEADPEPDAEIRAAQHEVARPSRDNGKGVLLMPETTKVVKPRIVLKKTKPVSQQPGPSTQEPRVVEILDEEFSQPRPPPLQSHLLKMLAGGKTRRIRMSIWQARAMSHRKFQTRPVMTSTAPMQITGPIGRSDFLRNSLLLRLNEHDRPF